LVLPTALESPRMLIRNILLTFQNPPCVPPAVPPDEAVSHNALKNFGLSPFVCLLSSGTPPSESGSGMALSHALECLSWLCNRPSQNKKFCFLVVFYLSCLWMAQTKGATLLSPSHPLFFPFPRDIPDADVADHPANRSDMAPNPHSTSLTHRSYPLPAGRVR